MGKKGKQNQPKSFTASHLMLYIILGVYIIVSLCGLYFVNRCMNEGCYEYSAQVLIALFSYIGLTVGTGFGFYCNKAKAENKLQIAMAKYKMRLTLAEEIFDKYGNSLDEKSVDILRKLMSDKDIEIDADTEVQLSQTNTPIMNIPTTSNYEEGLG